MMEIYTDGGCSGNPGPGGWAYVIIRLEDQGLGNVKPCLIAEKWGAEKSTTNNRMELKAVISALEALCFFNKNSENVTIYTDSQYVQKGITLWIKDWKVRAWKTKGKEPVKNQELWRQLDGLAAGFPITWTWVRGHAGNEYNELCDAMTKKAIASLYYSV
jgi:ribonuclease HI